MKNIVFIYVFLLFFSCKKKDVAPSATTPIYGQMSSFYANGKLMPREGFDLNVWATDNKKKGCQSPRFNLITYHHAKNDSLRERINISGIPYDKTGKILVKYTDYGTNPCDSITTARFYMNGSDGDVLIADYAILKQSNSYLTIDSYNASTKEIKGTYNLVFIADGTSEQTRKIYPDTIRFTDAKFTARIN
jgi:hypothetical protein